jgi:hypothetical protein
MPGRHRRVPAHRGRTSGMPTGSVVGLLVLLVIAVVLVAVAAFVIVPASLVLFILAVGWPGGVGARVRTWRLWRRLRGLEPSRRLRTFALVLVAYGIILPSASLALVVAIARSGGDTGQPLPSAPPAIVSLPAVAVVQPAPTLTVAPTQVATRAATPTQKHTPVPSADPCHSGGVTYCVLNPDVTQATIGQTICVSGWTATIRPPESYTEDLKWQQIREEGLSGPISAYEEDHRMPLELGGAPRNVENLSPESPSSPNPKDSDETSLKDAVCSGRLTLVQAQQEMVQQWLAAYPGYRQ